MQHSFTRKFFFAATLSLIFATNLYADDVDVTKYIVNPSFESGLDGWTITSLVTQTNNNFKQKSGKIYLEKWVAIGSAVGTASASQKLTGLPAGNYLMRVGAHNIVQKESGDATGDGTAQTGVTIYAKSTSNKTTVTAPADYDITFDTPGTDVTIGFRAANASGNWICVDNFRLYYTSADFTLLQTAITNAESLITKSEGAAYAGIQPTIKDNFLSAIAAAKTMKESNTDEELRSVSFELAETQALANENMIVLKDLKTLCTKSNNMLKNEMAAVYLEALQTAYNEASELLKLENDDPVQPVMDKLQTAYDNADASYKARKALNTSINTATTQLNKATATEGKEELQAAITAAEAVRDSDTATPEEMAQAQAAVEDATLLNRIQNATGNAVTVKTLSAIQGATEIFGRASFSGVSAKEKGFCWSETPEPTIFDNRSTTVYSNNGDIYAMQGLKPATVYYVRAYAYTSGFKLSYGDVIKVPTRPMGNVTFSYGYEGDDATDQRIYAACEEAVWMWNNIGGIQHFHLDAHYKYGAGAGTGTAECSYGGYMSVSQNTGCQRTGTILHEGAHGLGMVPYTDWVNSIYRADGDRGDWLGPRVDRAMQFLDNSSTAKLHGDNQHMWPYGINGAGEDTGSQILYRANALVLEALSEDGITHSGQGFLTPGYAFATSDATKYYIKSESADRGIATSYLRHVSGSTVRFAEASADEAFADDTYAWYITFNPKTCYYIFQNVASGKYLTMTAGAATATNNASVSYQLLGSRIETTYNDFTFAGSSYWIVNSNNHNAMNATTTGASSTTFNHANSATTQRWLLLTADEVTRFAVAQGETVGVGALRATPATPALMAQGGYGVIYITANGAGEDVEIYTLDGRLFKRLYIQLDATAQVRAPRGLYIVGGKKVLVR